MTYESALRKKWGICDEKKNHFIFYVLLYYADRFRLRRDAGNRGRRGKR